MILERIIKEIEKGEVTRYRISQDTGIPESTLCRLIHRQGGMSIPTADILCEYLGLELISKKKRKSKRA